MSNLDILGLGYTIYLGSENEGEMLAQAAQLVFQAHQAGLVTVLWIYPRGKAVKDEKDPHLIAGAAGNATGRNILQRLLAEAVRLCNAIYAVTVQNASVFEAHEIYQGD
jgi:DhnA family fructose-bisphosphate aldolase class Ia